MTDGQELPQYLPLPEFMKQIEGGDFDLTQLRTIVGQLSETTFGQNLSKYLDFVTSNTGAHAILRGELHPRGVESEFAQDNLPIRKEVARRIEQGTDFHFDTAVSTPEHKEEIWEALEKFTGIHTDDATRERINLGIPDKLPPSVYRIPWVGEDEVVIRQDEIYAIDRDVKPGHILNASEHAYTVFKGGVLKGVLSMTELSDYEIKKAKSIVYAKVSPKPLSQTYFTDKISGKARNEFVYLNPSSSYLQPAKPQVTQ